MKCRKNFTSARCVFSAELTHQNSNVYKKLGISYRTELMNLLYKMDEESRLK